MSARVLNKMAEAASEQFSSRETAENYHSVLAQRGKFRVIICACNYQWILQQRRKHFKPGGTAWDYLAYVTSKKVLIRLSRRYSGHEWPELAALPEHFHWGEPK
ncbi:hypothetical protein [Phycobacter sp. K97]|uniref:hypothetical protein n=1 Tax=Phycobacter sedimenti TaxID=3133977 RepID=UPI00311E72C3